MWDQGPAAQTRVRGWLGVQRDTRVPGHRRQGGSSGQVASRRSRRYADSWPREGDTWGQTGNMGTGQGHAGTGRDAWGQAGDAWGQASDMQGQARDVRGQAGTHGWRGGSSGGQDALAPIPCFRAGSPQCPRLCPFQVTVLRLLLQSRPRPRRWQLCNSTALSPLRRRRGRRPDV